ncbi:MAG: PSD1 and planctomycete cytochrome C domain-containing protein [Mariniblastus sp.]|nr:PSD1 and planctomycete cytochrome C domain-containing protein [Mariniblastus sp.]
MKTATFLTLCLIILASSCLPAAGQTDLNSDRQDELFTLQVLPLLKSKCFGCHGNDPDNLKGEYDLRTRSSALEGGESGGPAIVPGEPDQSPLLEAIRWDGLEMPPKENDRLDEQQIALIERWIESGASWPAESTQAEIRKKQWSSPDPTDGIRVKNSGGLADEWTYRTYPPEDIWAFQPYETTQLPAGHQHPIDAFLQTKLETAKIEMAPRADAATLIRRATYDLTGLPPTPEEVAQFERASRKNQTKAWNDLITRLLAKPQYGERWGQHWLDVVRYADTAGMSNDYERSNAWRYRDYVVRSFNQNKPYNHFIIEQLAADDLVREQEKSEDGKNFNGYTIAPAEAQVATGFLRMGPWEHTAMSPERVSRQNYLDDTVNSIGQAFLSVPLRCCKCHDHKFDPIPTRDYYRFYAALATTQPAEMKAKFLASENRDAFEEERTHVQALLEYATTEQNKLYAKREAAAKKWYEERGIPDQYKPFNERRIQGQQKFFANGEEAQIPPRFIGLTSEEQGVLKVREGETRIWTRRLERFEPLAQSVYYGGDTLLNSRKLRPPNTKNRKLMEQHKTLPLSHIYEGGSVESLGDPVSPGVLSSLQVATYSGNEQEPYSLPQAMDRRRVALARWIAHPENPLTKRSIVNRIWQYHFGKALAGNPNNLGATGKKPTHPDLLNWLADDFVNNGWRIKRLHRLIMTSAAYQASTRHPNAKQLETSDPEGTLWAVFQPRRLSAEEIRDTLLAATGELNLAVGGLPARPEINLEVALAPRMVQFSLAPAYQPSRTPEMRNRRSIYAYRVCGLPNPMMEVFNQPKPEESCELRDSASVSPQVFTLMNSDSVTKRSIAMARRLTADADSIEERVRRGFTLLGLQSPSPATVQLLVDHFEEMKKYHTENQPEPREYPVRLARSVVEEFTGEACHYIERLDIYENYVPDLHPSDVPPETRALADICLLLFNSNEFIFVY